MPKHKINLPDGVQSYLPPCANCGKTMVRKVTNKGDYFTCNCGAKYKVPAIFLIGCYMCGDLLPLTEAARKDDWVLNICKPCHTGTKEQ